MSDSSSSRHLSMDCDVEAMESTVQSEHCSMPLQDSSGTFSGVRNADVLLHHGVSTNDVPIGGRKRLREEMEDDTHKRIRTGGIN